MKFSRKLTSDRGVDSSIWELRDARILGADGSKVFEQKDVEVPKFWNDNALRIVASKYFKTINGVPEKSVKDLIARVVDTVCKWGSKDKYFTTSLDRTVFHDELTHILTYQYAAFNTPVWLNLGVPTRPQTGAACFLIDVEDSLDSINDDWYTTELKIFKAGAGSGLNVSKLRPRNAALSGGGVGSGPVSFMKAADYQAGVIKSGGTARRSAKMVVMNVDHPDIEEFVTCKTKEEAKAKALIAAGYDSSFEGEAYSTVAFQNTNHSVRVTKDFMQKVVDGNPEVNHLIDLMAEEAWKTGDPGIQYQDTIDKYYTVPACGPQVTSNVCSEIFQNSWSACTLCCINLLKFQTEAHGYDYDLLRHVVSTITVALDIIVANSDYPNERIAQNSKNQRHIGIGYCNLGALLMTEGLAYDSDAGRHLAAKMTSYITGQAYNTSANIASDLGPFNDFEANKGKMLDVIKLHNDSSSEQFMDQTLATLWSDTVTKGVLYGYRNAHVTALMPSGTVAFMMGADTTGVEPTIALTIYKNMVGGGSFKLVSPLVPKALESLGYFGTEQENVLNYFEKNSTLIGSSLSKADLPVFATSFGDIPLSPMAHVKMVAAVQPYVSQGISKTVNLPSTATVAEIKQVYIESWNLGLKSVAVYRDGCKATQPLNTKKEEVKPVVPEIKSNRAALPDERPAIIHKIEIGDFEGYLHVGLYANGQPGELFIDASKVGSSLQGLLDAFATSVSYSLQYGVPLEVLVEKFTNWRFEPAGFTKNKDIPMTSSVIDYIFRWLEHKFIKPINREETPVIKAGISTGELCTTCGSLMIRTGTCFSCSQCGKAGGCG